MASPPRSEGRRAAAAALALAVAASFVSAPLIAASRPTPPLAVAFWRLALAAAVLLPLGARRTLHAPALATRSVRLLSLFSALALAVHFICWMTALRLTTIAAATTLVNATPLALVGLEYAFFRQVPGRAQWIGILVAVLGVVLISSGGWALSPRVVEGDALALAGAFADALYLVAGRAVRPNLGAVPYNLLVFGVAAAALGVGAAWGHVALLGYSLRVWWLFAALAAVPTLLGHAMANYSLGRLPATTVGLGYLLEPVGASLLGYLWLHQAPRAADVWGGLVTLLGLAIYLSARQGSPAQRAGPRERPDPHTTPSG